MIELTFKRFNFFESLEPSTVRNFCLNAEEQTVFHLFFVKQTLKKKIKSTNVLKVSFHEPFLMEFQQKKKKRQIIYFLFYTARVITNIDIGILAKVLFGIEMKQKSLLCFPL